MDRLKAKGDYFKHTTRQILTEGEKQETIAAVERSMLYLNRMSSSIDNSECISVETNRASLLRFRDRMKYMSRAIALTKGSSWPKHVYRRTRRFQLETQARMIADETGAEFDEVLRTFRRMMERYVSDLP